MLQMPLDAIADGKIHRFGKNKREWYILFESSKFGFVGDWSTGERLEWREEGYAFSDIDRKTIKKAKEEQEKLQLKNWENVSEQALEYIDECKVKGHSEYLQKKKISLNGALFFGNKLVLPLQDAEGKVWSYQDIYPNGQKMFASGGKIKGCYFPIYGENNDLVVVCEGFATGASIHQATGLTVICAMNAGNLKTVCNSLPYNNIVIAADNDASGVGEAKAKETGYKYVMPAEVGTDFSDLWVKGEDIQSYFIEEKKEVKQSINVGGLVQEIADWITATATKPQPLLSLAAALSFVGMLKGHRVQGATGLRTNLLILSLAPSTYGKEYPQFCINQLAEYCGLDSHMMGEPTSGSALLSGINKAQGVSLLCLDEIGRYLANISLKTTGGYQREIVDYIIKLFSSANRTFRGKQYANEKENPQIVLHQPHFGLLGSTVQNKLASSCTSSEMIDGFLNRWIVFNVTERTEEVHGNRMKHPPQKIVDAVNDYVAKNPVKYSSGGKPNPQDVRMTKDAFAALQKFKESMIKLVDSEPYPINMLYARAGEHCEKIALTIFEGEEISLQDIQNAISIVEQSNSSLRLFASAVSDNQHEADLIYVLEKIKEHKKISKSQLTRITQKLNQKIRNDILNQLVEAERITFEKLPNDKIIFSYVS